jgi:serine/threonine-protein kinase
MGMVAIESTPSTQVWIDGARKGRSPFSGKLGVGTHAIELRDDEVGLRHKASVEIDRGQTRRLEWRPGKGTVLIRAWPYAEVFLRKRSLGMTPIEPIELYEGRHEFTFVNKETSKRETRGVDVKPGQETLVKVDLRGN